MRQSAPSAVLAFDVGGTAIKAEVLDEHLAVWASGQVRSPRGPAVVDAAASLGESLLSGLPERRRAAVAAVGIAVPGIVDTGRGTSVYAANLDLHDVAVSGPLSRRLRLPVVLGHDVTAAADAEQRCGAAADVQDPVVVVIGTGIAAVSYVHGRQVRGVSGQAGELGHVVVRPGGPACACGARGCLEAVASASAIRLAYQEASGQEVSGAEDVVERLGSDASADRVWREATDALGDALLTVTALIAPGAVVLGGGLAEAGRTMLDPVRARMEAGARAVQVPPLLLAAHGSRAGVVGAGLLAIDEVRRR